MIDDLDRTLEELLRRELPSNLVGQVAISFVTPDAQFPPSTVNLPAIDFFLYDIRENRSLRSNEWWNERQPDGSLLKMRAPVRLDCSYLVTAWASPHTTTAAQDEHHLLGEVMKVLLRYPTLPPALLQGSLQNDQDQEQEVEPPACALQSGHLQSVAELWQALGGRPRAALNYTVTLAVAARTAEVAPPPATDVRIVLQTGVGPGGR